VAIDFLRTEVGGDKSLVFDMCQWIAPVEANGHNCKTVCCIGGSMALAFDLACPGDEPEVIIELSEILGLSRIALQDMFFPMKGGSVFTWDMTKDDAIAALEGVRDGKFVHKDGEGWVAVE